MRRRLFRTISALLLAGQSVTAASVGFAHVRERVSAPATIEAEHGSECVVAHDPARCPGCQAVGVAALPQASRSAVSAAARGTRSLTPTVTATPTPAFRRATPPRAPPAALSV